VRLVQLGGVGQGADLDDALRRLLAPLGGLGAFVRPGQRVLLKPNLGFARSPETHAITSPELIAAVARAALEAGAAQVRVIDHPVDAPDRVLAASGLRERLQAVTRDERALKLLVALAPIHFVARELPRGKALRRAEVLAEALRADVHIALPKAKSHGATLFTGTLKGQMGLIRDRLDFHTGLDLHQAVADLASLLRPGLVIMDGLAVMTAGGPQGPGPLAETRALLAGTDPVAVDAAGVRLAPLQGRKVLPRQVKHLRLAAEMGLGRLELPPEEQRLLEL
jgi:uncharacterized protein (DUF362 family)